jgi:hypothetical protein
MPKPKNQKLHNQKNVRSAPKGSRKVGLCAPHFGPQHKRALSVIHFRPQKQYVPATCRSALGKIAHLIEDFHLDRFIAQGRGVLVFRGTATPGGYADQQT